MPLTTALLYQDGNFVGREYYRALAEAGRAPALVAAVGRIRPESVEREIARTGGGWNPPAVPADVSVHRFQRLDDPALIALLCARDIELAIQGGLGILGPAVLSAPSIGFVNVHPGRLPAYRGNSCPEWALLEGQPVVTTAHLIDEGIDTGPVVHAQEMTIEPGWAYEDFRAHLYGHCACVLIEAIARLEREGPGCATPQPEAGACYRAPMPDEKMARVRALFAVRAAAGIAR
jgi:methionyl-tRNA formyltransferase